MNFYIQKSVKDNYHPFSYYRKYTTNVMLNIYSYLSHIDFKKMV